MTFKEKLINLRKAFKRTQESMAILIGVNPNHYSGVERGIKRPFSDGKLRVLLSEFGKMHEYAKWAQLAESERLKHTDYLTDKIRYAIRKGHGDLLRDLLIAVQEGSLSDKAAEEIKGILDASKLTNFKFNIGDKVQLVDDTQGDVGTIVDRYLCVDSTRRYLVTWGEGTHEVGEHTLKEL